MRFRRSRPRRRFVPTTLAGSTSESALEPRMLLNGSPLSVGAPIGTTEQPITTSSVLGQRVSPVLIGGYSRGVLYRDSAMTRVTDAIDQAFDSFTTDYLQAQAAYLATPAPDEATASALQKAFKSATTERVNLLAQQLTESLSRVPGSLNRRQGQSATALQQFLVRRITAPQPAAPSLLSTLLSSSVVPPPGTSGSFATLYTLTSTNAIEAARVNTLNAARFTSSGVFRQHH